VELPTTKISPDHVEFDLMCSEVEDFEPLPAMPSRPLKPELETEDETSLDGQILAGLVTP
jgi:hypothetical protein